MKVLGIMETLEDFFDDAGRFVERNFDNPGFWIVICLIIVAIGFFGIGKFANK